MTDLETLRDQIDQIDERIRDLYVNRLELVKAIAAYKMAHDMPVYDASRESQVIAKNVEAVTDEALRPLYRDVLETIMKTAKDLQKTIVLRSTYETLD